DRECPPVLWRTGRGRAMTAAHYAVVRYIADPGRGEPFNVGVVLWDSEGYLLRIDRDAVKRVSQQSPWLEEDALHHLEADLAARLALSEPFHAGQFATSLAKE